MILSECPIGYSDFFILQTKYNLELLVYKINYFIFVADIHVSNFKRIYYGRKKNE